PMITPEERTASAPTTATDNLSPLLHHEECAVLDQLTVHAKNGTKRLLSLRGRIVSRLQLTHGQWNEPFQGRDVLRPRQPRDPMARLQCLGPGAHLVRFDEAVSAHARPRHGSARN